MRFVKEKWWVLLVCARVNVKKVYKRSGEEAARSFVPGAIQALHYRCVIANSCPSSLPFPLLPFCFASSMPPLSYFFSLFLTRHKFFFRSPSAYTHVTYAHWHYYIYENKVYEYRQMQNIRSIVTAYEGGEYIVALRTSHALHKRLWFISTLRTWLSV